MKEKSGSSRTLLAMPWLLARSPTTLEVSRDLLSKELARRVNKAVKELPEELRTAITLREIEGLSYEEIATVMECPIGTVRSRIFRAREAIDKQLQPLMN